MGLKDFNETFQDELRDPELVAPYLEAALEDARETGDTGAFLIAIRNMLRAKRKNIAGVAGRSGKSYSGSRKIL